MAQLDVGAFHAHDYWNFELEIFCGGDHAGGEYVAAQDAAEDVDEHGAHAGIAHEDAEGVFDLFGGGAAADVEKIGGRAAGIFDDVHSGHGEAGAIDHAGYGAIELDVVEAVFGGFDFEGIFFVEIAQGARRQYR